MRASVLALLGACICVVSVPGPAQSAPVIQIKARTDITLLPAVRQGDGVLVRGEVVRRHSREPVIARDVKVRLNDEEKQARTDGSGVFEALFFVDDGRYDLVVSYAGDDTDAPSQAEVENIDIGKQNVRLGVSAENVSYGKDTIDITVTAVSQGKGVTIELDIYAGSATDLRPLGKLTTNQQGLTTYKLARADLGGPGRKRVVARFAGDASFNPTEAQTDLVVSTATTTSISLETGELAFEADLVVDGRVSDESDTGIANGPVALKVGSRRLASALTDDEGAFRFRVPGAEIGPGTFHVQAVFEPSTPWELKSRSAVVPLQVAEMKPVPIAHTLTAFGATALAIVAFFGLRTRPWEAWMLRLRKGARPESDGEEGEADDQPVEGGLRLSATGIGASLRRPNDFDFSGTVHDAVTRRPVPGSAIALALDGGAGTQQRSDARGSFHFADLAAGQWQATVSSAGYVTERFAIAIPHRGDLRDAHIDLVPVRERIFAMYRQVAEPLLPGPDQWGIWTPRQIFAHVRRQQRARAMARLTNFVEETYFSQRTPEESVLEEAARQMEAARVELAALLEAAAQQEP